MTQPTLRDVLMSSIPADIPVSVVIFVFFLGLMGLAGIILDCFFLLKLSRNPPDWRDSISRLSSRAWHWQDALRMALVLVFVQLLVIQIEMLRRKFFHSHDAAHTIFPLLLQTLLFDGACVLVIWHQMRSRATRWGTTFGIQPGRLWRDVGRGLIFYLAAMPPIVLCSLIYSLFLVGIGYPVETDAQESVQILKDPSYPFWIKMYLGAFAISAAPIVEELVFRGIALPVVARHARFSLSVILVSLVFASMHMNTPAMMVLFLIASAFSVGYLVSGSIVVPITMHVAFNAVSITAAVMMRNLPALGSMNL